MSLPEIIVLVIVGILSVVSLFVYNTYRKDKNAPSIVSPEDIVRTQNKSESKHISLTKKDMILKRMQEINRSYHECAADIELEMWKKNYSL